MFVEMRTLASSPLFVCHVAIELRFAQTVEQSILKGDCEVFPSGSPQTFSVKDMNEASFWFNPRDNNVVARCLQVRDTREVNRRKRLPAVVMALRIYSECIENLRNLRQAVPFLRRM
jgi:hypothetical protein